MTENREDPRAEQPETASVPQFPRLFSEADGSAVEGAFDEAEGVGEAGDRAADAFGERDRHVVCGFDHDGLDRVVDGDLRA